MKIIKAAKKHSRDISKLMRRDLDNPPKEFSQEFLVRFREHAKEENILKEFDNPLTVGFIAIINEKTVGFIVGYIEDSEHAMIHYINGEDKKIKKSLLLAFIAECKDKKMTHITTDSFEFMENDGIFEEQGFGIYDKEKVDRKIVMLWRKLNLSK